MSHHSKNDPFMSLEQQGKVPFVFSHKDKFINSNIDMLPILNDSRVLSNHLSKKIQNRNQL